VLANAVFPNLAARVATLVNRALPVAGSHGGDAVPGWQARGSFPPAAVTALPDQASDANNEVS